MARTSTGGFSIGFRRGWGEWQKELPNVIQWAKANQFEAIDLGAVDPADVKSVVAAGLRVGTTDLKAWSDLGSADAGKRKESVALNTDYIKSIVAAGCKNFFICVLPADPSKPRKENFANFVAGFIALCDGVKSTGARLAIEGYPGGAPWYGALACTPADYREMFKQVNSEVMAVNFDPSHLIRMGVDPLRFLGEFAPRVVHVHGKDTEIMEDELYEHGNLQPATFAPHHGFGAHHWRYTIPGHGCAHWTKMFSVLKEAKYSGCVCIELEDERYNGTDDGDKKGFIAGRQYLETV
ncbi:MAG: sugar phosphate isomerase/epimerase [Planctomycetes bacterium]|nr:sugar phosphate isomerase/epimerase [Planctomycetota bacterium]